MTKASDNEYPSVLFGELGAAPTTPATGNWRLYTKSTGLFIVDDAGAETGPFGAGGGSVATDAIWDAAGDLAVGTGANTAARVAIGATGTRLASNGTTAAWGAPVAGAVFQVGPYTTTSGTPSRVDATNLKITKTTGAHRVLIGFSGVVKHSSTTLNVYLGYQVDSASIELPTYTLCPSNTYGYNASFTALSAVLTAASHDFYLCFATDGATAGLQSATFWILETDATA